ncbi:MAG: hypothetical protein PXX73_04665 [Sideroxydans sp.]|nr:hypothetical protein [Sideroxydans sp.]
MEVDRTNLWLAVLIFVMFAALFGVVGYEAMRPDFTLNKDEWICTHSKTKIIYQWQGKTGYPVNVEACQTWQRKGSF